MYLLPPQLETLTNLPLNKWRVKERPRLHPDYTSVDQNLFMYLAKLQHELNIIVPNLLQETWCLNIKGPEGRRFQKPKWAGKNSSNVRETPFYPAQVKIKNIA